MTRRAVIYIRLSSYRGAADPSTSPETQEAQCRAYAEAKGWEVIDVVRDLDVSGSDRGERLDRPGLQRIRDLYRVADVVIFARLDRLARNVRDFSTFAEEARDHGADLVSVAEALDLTTIHGKAFAQIIAVFAEMEAATIAARTAAGREEAKRQGRFTGGIAPFGTRAVDRPEGGRVLEVDPDTAPILKELVAMYLDGAGGPTLARWLIASGVPTRFGTASWRATTVMSILHQHAAESLVLSPAERHALRDALAKNAPPPSTAPRGQARSLLAGGVMRCATCGSAMRKLSPGKKRRANYACNQDNDSRARHGFVIADDAEELIIATFLEDWAGHRPSVRVIPAEQWDLDLATLKDKANALRAELATATGADLLDVAEAVRDAEEAAREFEATPPPRVVSFTRADHTLGELWDRADNVHDRRALLLKYIAPVLCSPARDANGRLRPTAERLTIPRIFDDGPDEFTDPRTGETIRRRAAGDPELRLREV